ncbi:hypothetical protein [Streptomyces anulatus]|uniref:hypothetical protein n=1 Tax=Streptomyces anulatus TaxID=1892 RepID=UPI00365F8A1C
MTTPAPAQLPGEPFSEALSEAAQAAAMSVRLILTIADAVRRASQKHHHGQEQELGPDAENLAEGWSAEQLRTVLPEGALHDLMADANWPVMARQLAGLQHAGVDLTAFLPNLGRMAAGVEHAVARNIARIQAEGTDRWAELLRTTIPEGLVRDAILASPAWPDIAAHMGRLHDQGVDVARILTDAHAAGLGVDQAIAAAAVAPAPPHPLPPLAPRTPLPPLPFPLRQPPLLLRPPRPLRPLPRRPPPHRSPPRPLRPPRRPRPRAHPPRFRPPLPLRPRIRLPLRHRPPSHPLLARRRSPTPGPPPR